MLFKEIHTLAYTFALLIEGGFRLLVACVAPQEHISYFGLSTKTAERSQHPTSPVSLEFRARKPCKTTVPSISTFISVISALIRAKYSRNSTPVSPWSIIQLSVTCSWSQ